MKTPISLDLIARSYRHLVKAASWLQSPFLLLVRLYWGWSFMQTGWGKLTDLGKVTKFFASLHIPLPGVSAAVAGATECLGGTLLLLGLASRLTAFPLIFTMLVAYRTAEWENVTAPLSDPDLHGFSAFTGVLDKITEATPFTYFFACVLILIFGPGVFSLDWILGRKFGKAPASPDVSV